ncbi:hypothetical protein BDQ17DRAFT_1385982 [Cyathus striatus]|nr:hypothetical protein BDQ17DRAFT_1385982 [Cyathus striatus]
MAQPQARIRPFTPADDKLALFVIGKANLETLAVANNKVYTNPLTISAWLLLTSVLIQYMQWWPSAQTGVFGYLKPLPAFAAMAVPILALVDWINRPYFEQHVQTVLRQPDIQNIAKYYSPSASGFWILEYGDKFVGLIALDSSSKDANDKSASNTRSAVIRHFYVDEAFRHIRIQEDLLLHAVKHGFNSDSEIKSIRAPASSLAKYALDALCKFGFVFESDDANVGLFNWKLSTYVLDKKNWEKRIQ